MRCLPTLAHRPDPGFPRGAYTAWRLAAPVARGLGRWWVDFEHRGAAVPTGPVVIAANHFSHVDPVALGIDRQLSPLMSLAAAGGTLIAMVAAAVLLLVLWAGILIKDRARSPLTALAFAVRPEM